jgi:alkylated DNA nucleotide flippase Atl1
VDEIMRQVPKGKLITINEIGEILAKRHKATMADPITTGQFAWIAAYAAAEAEAAGKKRVTPYWRTIRQTGHLNPNWPGGLADLKKRLEAEGHKVVIGGKRYRVADYKQALVDSV